MDLIRCEGSPRALGLDQGRACASAIRVWLAARGLPARPRVFPGLRRLAGGATLGAGAGREVVRHYPHLVERMSGVARAARVPLASLMEDVVASAYGGGEHPLTAPAAAFAARGPRGAVAVARAFDSKLPWILRASRPEIGFSSVEVTLPWLAGGVAGVNEAGIAAVAAAPPAASIERAVCGAPAWLLVQECLQRFDSLERSLEWCLLRPMAGSFSLLLGDAKGEVAVVEVSAGSRELQQRAAGHAVAGGEPAARAALCKRVAQHERAGPEWLADEPVAGETAAQVWLDPGSSLLEWRPSGSDLVSLRLVAKP